MSCWADLTKIDECRVQSTGWDYPFAFWELAECANVQEKQYFVNGKNFLYFLTYN